MTALPVHSKVSGAMTESFDPYRKWLGIPLKDQPPHHYRLLGIATFEDDPDVIENAATRQMAHVRTFQTSKQHGTVSQRILTELSAAKGCLLDGVRKARYDEQLRSRLAAEGKLSSTDLTQAVAATPDEAEAVSEPDFPPLRRGPEMRWRTGVAPEGVAESTPVPIPMPPLSSTTVVAPAFGSLKRTSVSPARVRRKPSGLPILITALSLLALAVLAAGAVIIGNQIAGGAGNGSNLKPGAKATDKTSKSSSADDRGQASSEKTTAATTIPIEGAAASGTKPTAPKPSSGSGKPAITRTLTEPELSDLTDQVRQFLDRAESALNERNDGRFRDQITLAEQLLTQYPVETRQFQERATDLRVLSQLLSEFWSLVRDNLHNQLEIGERVAFRTHQFELLSRQGELIEFSFDGEKHSSEIHRLQPSHAVMAIAKPLKNKDPAALLASAAFLAVDTQEPEEARRPVARQLFALARQAGHPNPTLARQLGLSSIDEPIELDDDLLGP